MNNISKRFMFNFRLFFKGGSFIIIIFTWPLIEMSNNFNSMFLFYLVVDWTGDCCCALPLTATHCFKQYI